MAVNGELHPVICRSVQLGLFDLRLFRQRQGVVEQPLALGHIARLVRGVPNPLGLVEWGLGRSRLARRIVADPIGLPIPGLKQAHRPYRRLAPGGFAPVLVPDLHHPIAALVRDKRLALINGADGLVARGLAGVPKVALAPAEELLAAGDQQPVSRLPLPALTGLNDPAQARRGFVNAERINQVFAAEICRGEPFAGVGFGVHGSRCGTR